MIRALLIAASAVALYANATTDLAPEYNRMVHWGLMGTVALVAYGGRAAASPSRRAADWLLASLFAASTIFLIADYPDYIQRTGIVTPAELVAGLVMIVLVLETTRRVVGWFLVLMVVAALAYALAGQHLPGLFAHRGYDLSRLVGSLYLGSSGIYGLPIEISATFVIMFVLFGALLSQSGGDRWFMDLALALTGRLRGGPAISAVTSSALMGMISGSPVACVVTVGNFTIPLMTRSGFGRDFAGATVAVASTASMFTPPLMGAGAFLIAEYLQVPYSDVAKAAILPAALFYVALMATVYLWAMQRGIQPDRDAPLPKIGQTLVRYGHMAPPVVALVALIYMGRSLMQAAFWSIVLTLACSLLRSHTRIGLGRLLGALEDGARGVVPIAVACASAGIIVGIINLTGVGFTLSAALTNLAQGQPLLLLALIMTTALLLGMAIPPTAVYLVLAGLSVPAMTTAGFEPMAAHFFIFFFSSMGAITPPVALAAYAAAAISGSEISRTGWLAFRLGLAGYLIPFLCMYYGGLLLIGGRASIVVALGISLAIILGVTVVIHVVNRTVDAPSEHTERAV
ncbi:MAG: TRAP transporter fused permease subunit [Acidobacteria bacterium]|nr:TRAP transporter fused permease subunit [Acidobacteriota bacterium]